ncbi:MAG: bifunctional folylpolyglutamate synthase/dihydrofolate synthase [bacterium]|nr:bifunctional folylpolyglutamate synthase/dihydrofolate synthase [bacterium]
MCIDDKWIMAFEFLEKFGSKPGLERITKLLELWGNPQDKMKVVLVSGTNGKGSVTAFLSSILSENGFKTGSFFSPHLLHFNERMKINGEEIPDAEVARLEGEVKEWVDGGNIITYFEAVAACAYRYFAEQGVEYAIMEVGMGGRLDAVNPAEEKIAIITSVGLEHTKWLGSQVSQIAYEKAGIMKKGLAITGAGIGLETIRGEARKRGVNLLVLGEDFDGNLREKGIDGSVFDYSNEMQLEGLEIGMLGNFQVRNASLAVCAAENLGCSEKAIREGLKKARLRGRMEILGKEPLIVADVAHNPAGVKALVDSLDVFGEKKVICVFSCMQDKEYGEMLKVLGEKVNAFVVVKPERDERAEEPEVLLEKAKEYGEAYTSAGIKDGVEFAKEMAGPDGMVLVTGSIYMMEEVYSAISKK